MITLQPETREWWSPIYADRASVRAARAELLEIARLLRDLPSVSARGVALVTRLVRDGATSPLYQGPALRLREELGRIRHVLVNSERAAVGGRRRPERAAEVRAEGRRGAEPAALRDVLDGQLRALEQLARMQDALRMEPAQWRGARLGHEAPRERPLGDERVTCHVAHGQRARQMGEQPGARRLERSGPDPLVGQRRLDVLRLAAERCGATTMRRAIAFATAAPRVGAHEVQGEVDAGRHALRSSPGRGSSWT